MNNIDKIKKLYQKSFDSYGDSPSSVMNPKARYAKRYKVLDDFITLENRSILDYGCGIGLLCNYLSNNKFKFRYTGVDMVPEFINFCQNKFPPKNKFKLVSPSEKIINNFDIIFMSGVFNLKTDENSQFSKKYVFQRLKELFDLTNEILICDFLSSEVDFQQPDAQHFSIDEVSSFCFNNLGRKFAIRHDLLPYEFSLIIFKDSQIRKSDNTYKISL